MSDQNTCTRATVARYLTEKHGCSKAVAANFVDDFFSQVSSVLSEGRQIKFSKFGVFSLLDKTSRPGRNPKTKEECVIQERRVVVFRATNKFKSAINQLLGKEDSKPA